MESGFTKNPQDRPKAEIGYSGHPISSSRHEIILTTLAAPTVPSTVRSVLRLRAAQWRLARPLIDDVTVCAVELVSNACAATPDEQITFHAVLHSKDGTLWIGVWDSSDFMPLPKATTWNLADIDALPDDYEFGGWGLPLVMSLAAKHAVKKTPGGKWVCAQFRL